MNSNASDPMTELRQRFPRMRPVTSAPALFRINGCGLGVYGSRDPDPATGTYVKTHCICLLFVPVIALGAYRVADAERGWYFIGKEPLSGLAKGWNFLLAWFAAIVGIGLGWTAYTDSPEYRAKQELKTAAGYVQAGQPLKAADVYRHLANNPAAFPEAREGLRTCLEQCLQSDSSVTVERALRVVADLPPQFNQPTSLVPDAFQRGLSQVEKFRAKDPEASLDILQAASTLSPTNDTVKPLRIGLLKQAIVARTDNTNRAIELALVYEADHQLEQSIAVLQPFKSKLGTTEGARILGQALLQEGKPDEACGLLYPYVQARLKKLNDLQRSYTNTLAAAQKRILADLQEGRGDPSFYRSYKRASETEQDKLVIDYVNERMTRDSSIHRVVAELKAATPVVHVTLDLGIAQLNRAQNQTDPATRRAELEAAEKTLLSIRGFAGDTEEYQLFLGQVYYWLGKSEQGKEQFDQLLATSKRDPHILLSLAQTLREVGDNPGSRALSEEAFRTGKNDEDRHAAAELRASSATDPDDEIVWLEKADSKNNSVQIKLNSARGEQALQRGQKTEAARFLRAAIRGYDALPRSAATLNNCGLACFTLYAATTDPADEKRGLALLEEAVALEPGSSILLINTLQQLLSRSVLDVVRDSIHPEVIAGDADPGLLGHLYDNDEERVQLIQRWREDEKLKKSLSYLDKALVLAPKNENLYQLAVRIYGLSDDLGALRKIQQRLPGAALDFAESRKNAQEFLNGTRDKQFTEWFQARIRTLETALKTPSVQNDPLTLEYVTVELINTKQRAHTLGLPIDSAELTARAQAAYDRHHSANSRNALLSTLFLSASDELGRANSEFANLRRRTRRTVAPSILLAAILERGGPLQSVVRQNQNVQKALVLIQEDYDRYPNRPSPYVWALLHNIDRDRADRAAATIKGSELLRLKHDLQFATDKFGAPEVLEHYWLLKLLGEEARATETYQEAVQNGIPLPPL